MIFCGRYVNVSPLDRTKMNPVANKKKEPSLPDFEGTLKKLESIVTQMESGELSLEQALKNFEDGVALARECQQALRQAEQRVQVLMADNAESLPPEND